MNCDYMGGDYHLFPPLKQNVGGNKFTDDPDMGTVVTW
jgi:hypothetical protein